METITTRAVISALASYGYQTAMYAVDEGSTADLVEVLDHQGRDRTELVVDEGEITAATGPLADNALTVLALYGVITEEQRKAVPATGSTVRTDAP